MESRTKELERLRDLLKEKERREKCNQIAKYKPYDFQLRFHAAGQWASQRLLIAANRVGKRVVSTTPVYTYDGCKEIGDLVIGDLVMSEDGRPYPVMGVYDSEGDGYRMTFDDGTSVVCDGEHLWKYTMRHSISRDGIRWKVGTLNDIIKYGGMNPIYKKRVAIPLCSPVQFKKKELPLHPYIVGVLIANGYLGDSGTEISVHYDDYEIIERVKAHLPGDMRVTGESGKIHHRIAGNRKRLKGILESLYLQGKTSPFKRIPTCYKYTSVGDRIDLLRGLMDCDGTVDKGEYRQMSYSTKSICLAEEVRWLIQSLGGKSNVNSFNRESEGKGVEFHVSVWLPGINPFHTKRKAMLVKETRRSHPFRILHKIEPCGKQKMRCIEIASPEHTYLINDFIVTHNTESAAAETTYHLTGRYPDWWEGKRFRKPILCWACGASNEKTRDTVQKKLFGDPMSATSWGTGFVPRDCLSGVDDAERRVRRPNVANALQAVAVKHYTDGISDGWSIVALKSYEAGIQTFTSESVDVIWLDEEPPGFIMTQCLARQVDNPGILYMTFTPEYGMTQVVDAFLNHLQSGQCVINATWADAPHLTPERIKQILAALPEHERDMRSKGIPVLGSGLVFPVTDEEIKCRPFEIPPWYRLIAGLDIGAWNHDTATAWIAYNADTDTIYVYDEYKAQGKTPPVHAAAIKSRGEDILVVWPHDANKGDRHTGETVAEMYRKLGVNMHHQHFTNPPPLGKEEGQGNISKDAGLLEMLTRMETGRLKVFDTCAKWFEEKRMYHRKDGKTVDVNDDLLSATRYAVMMLRHANTRMRKDESVIIACDTDFDPLA